MKPRVLLTGGSGLLALNWALAVRERFNVVLLQNSRQVSVTGLRNVKTNFEDLDSLSKLIQGFQPCALIHTAGLTNIEYCEAWPDKAKKVNVELTQRIARVCHLNSLQMVYVSTDQLFSGKSSFYRENDIPSPLNCYGRTKFDAEKKVQETNPNALIIRTNFFGWGTSYRESFSDKIIKCLFNKQDIYLFTDVYFTPVLAETLALAVHELLELRFSGILNISSEKRISKYEFGVRLARVFNLDVSYIKPCLFADRKDLVNRPLNMSLSNQKASKILKRTQLDLQQDMSRLKDQEALGYAGVLRLL